MKLYKYTFGDWELYGPANDDADAYERRESIDPQFHFVPVVIEEVKLEGYEIVVSPLLPNQEDNRELLSGMNREKLKEWLAKKGVEFVPQWGEDKLRELAMQHYNTLVNTI